MVLHEEALLTLHDNSLKYLFLQKNETHLRRTAKTNLPDQTEVQTTH